MVSKVVKRDGSVVDFDSSKISAAILKALSATDSGSAEDANAFAVEVEKELVDVFDGRSATIEQIQDLVEKVLMRSNENAAKAYILYRQKRAEARAENRGLEMHPLGRKIFLDRYALKDMTRKSLSPGDLVLSIVDEKSGQREVGFAEEVDRENGFVRVKLDENGVIDLPIERVDKPLETKPEQMMDRVARAISSVEVNQEEWFDNFKWLLNDWKFIPGGRILAGAGSKDLSYYNCFVIPSPHDSRKGILETLMQMAEIMSRGGGVGINLSSLRPRHTYVKGVNGRSSGSVSWGAVYSFVTNLIEQGGSRRGALMLILGVWHPDVSEFVNSKRIAGMIEHANISLAITDDFMEAVKKDLDWQLVFPDTSDPDYDEVWDGNLDKWRALGKPIVVYKTMPARKLWGEIVESAWASAEPGIFFIDRYNKMSNSWYYSPILCTNPCGEQGLPAWGVCNLGSLNLSKFVAQNPDGTKAVKWEDLGRSVRYAVRFLDDVIDATPYFFEENKKQQASERRIGLGTIGLADMLIQLGIRYGSEESVSFIDDLFRFISTQAYLQSTEIAAEKGAFPKFSEEKFLQSGYARQLPEEVKAAIAAKGMRNVTMLTQAPTGSTGTMVGTSTGMEPFYYWSFKRVSRLGTHEERVNVYDKWTSVNPGKPLPSYFVTAMDLTPEEHVRVEAAIQRWVDSSISKTCNVPTDYTIEQTGKLYELMYDWGCKGGTVYRDKSREKQVLIHEAKKKMEETAEVALGKKPSDLQEQASGNQLLLQPKEIMCRKCNVPMNRVEGCATCPQCQTSLCTH
jgi:ribonucleoside-diphosphate reductase alpha chain